MELNSTSEEGMMKALGLVSIVLIPVVCVVGIVGNAMAVLLIRTHHYLKKLASNRYLCVLSICSCTVLAVHLGVWFEIMAPNRFYLYRTSEAACKIITYLGATADFAAVWLIVAVCIDKWCAGSVVSSTGSTSDRVILVYRPSNRMELCTLKSSGGFVVAILLFAILFNSAILIYSHVGRNQMGFAECSVHTDMEQLHLVFSWLETCFGVLVPWLLILVANSCVLYRLRTFRYWRHVDSTVRFSSSVEFAMRNGTNSTAPTTPKPQKAVLAHTNNNNTLADSSETSNPDPLAVQQPLLPPLLKNSANVSFSLATGGPSDGSVLGGYNMKPKDVQITKSLLWVTTLFVVLNLPSYLVRLLINSTVEHTLYIAILYTLSYFMSYCHHAVVFYVYIFNSPQMRKLLKPTALRLLECYCLKPVPDFGHDLT